MYMYMYIYIYIDIYVSIYKRSPPGTVLGAASLSSARGFQGGNRCCLRSVFWHTVESLFGTSPPPIEQLEGPFATPPAFQK